MAFTRKHLMGVMLVSGLLTYGLGACSSDSDTGTSATGAGGSGGRSSGGTTSSGGASSVSSSSGGSQGGATSSSGGQAGSSSSSKGGDASGGKTSAVTSSGGTTAGGSSGTQVTSSGGGTSISTAQGGAAGTSANGTGGTTGGGSTGTVTGGKGGSTMTGTVATGGATGGSTGTTPGECKKGGFKGSELVIFGESFYDWQPPYIKQRMEENARKAGSLGASDSYRQVAVAGQNMSYIANTEYDKAVSGGKFTKVVMDGGGIDCMSSSCPTCPDTLKGLFDKFAKQGVDQVIYTRYPEPGNPPGSNASLKKNLDALMPNMQKVCEGATNLKCYWVDLRPLWPAEKDKYTSDGLHPTKTGGDVVGDAIWAEMVKQCMAQ